MHRVELLFDSDCPNVNEAREQLHLALEWVGAEPHWHERRLDDEDLPEHARGYGSPTILIDGRDVVGSRPAGSRCCRVYPQGDGALCGSPSAEQIIAALRSRASPQGELVKKDDWRMSGGRSAASRQTRSTKHAALEESEPKRASPRRHEMVDEESLEGFRRGLDEI